MHTSRYFNPLAVLRVPLFLTARVRSTTGVYVFTDERLFRWGGWGGWGGCTPPSSPRSHSNLWSHVLSGGTPVSGPMSLSEGTPVSGPMSLLGVGGGGYPQGLWYTPARTGTGVPLQPGLGYHSPWPGLPLPSPPPPWDTGYTVGGMPLVRVT